MTRDSWPKLGAIALSLIAYAATANGQSQIVNAKLETRQATRGLDAEIQSVAAQGAAAWVAYRVATVRGPQHMCNSSNWTSTKVMLEPASELTILVRVENGRIERLQSCDARLRGRRRRTAGCLVGWDLTGTECGLVDGANHID